MKKLRFEYWKNKILKTHENFIKNLGRIEEVAELQENRELEREIFRLSGSCWGGNKNIFYEQR